MQTGEHRAKAKANKVYYRRARTINKTCASAKQEQILSKLKSIIQEEEGHWSLPLGFCCGNSRACEAERLPAQVAPTNSQVAGPCPQSSPVTTNTCGCLERVEDARDYRKQRMCFGDSPCQVNSEKYCSVAAELKAWLAFSRGQIIYQAQGPYIPLQAISHPCLLPLIGP